MSPKRCAIRAPDTIDVPPDGLRPRVSTVVRGAGDESETEGSRMVIMANAAPTEVGSVVALWRYPVKSMMGEELNASELGEGGLLGDRAYALVDRSDGKVATAKNPRKC